MKNRQRRLRIPESQYLPMELWPNILSRLPVKSVLRFRCVSNSMRDIIDDPTFISLHFHNCPNNTKKSNLLVTKEGFKPGKWLLTFRHSHTFRRCYNPLQISGTHHIMNSIDGLFLLTEIDPHDPEKGRKNVRLWNPSIRKSLLLPYTPFSRYRNGCRLPVYALGCSNNTPPLSNGYKVISFQFQFRFSSQVSVAIYSVKDGFWRIPIYGMPVPIWWRFPIEHCHYVFSKGALHWIVRDFEQSPNSNTHVLSFDLDVEEFRLVELPHDDDEKLMWFLYLHGESVAVFGISPVSSCIWLMDNEAGKKGQWTKWYSGGSSSDGYEFFQLHTTSKLANSMIDQFIEQSGTFLVKDYRKVTCYNIESHQIQHLTESDSHSIKYIDTYVESLVLFRGFDGQTLTSFL